MKTYIYYIEYETEDFPPSKKVDVYTGENVTDALTKASVNISPTKITGVRRSKEIKG